MSFSYYHVLFILFEVAVTKFSNIVSNESGGQDFSARNDYWKDKTMTQCSLFYSWDTKEKFFKTLVSLQIEWH